MPTDDIRILIDVMKLPPEEAIAFLRAKGYQITWDWHETDTAASARAFTVAKATSYDVLRDIREALDDALVTGKTVEVFARELEPTLQARGWWGKQEVTSQDGETRTVQLGSQQRLRTIYQTNLQSAFMAGRERQMSEVAEQRPFWRYIAILDGRTRPKHKELNGKVFRHDDPFWKTFYPPNGYNCRCRVTSMSAREVERDGYRVLSTNERNLIDMDAVDEIKARTWKTKAFISPDNLRPIHPDEGFAGNPAQLQTTLNDLAEEKRRRTEKALDAKLPDRPPTGGSDV